MEAKLKRCNGCEEDRIIWKNFEGNKYCLSCWNKIKPNKPLTPKQSKPINKVSDKRKELNKVYSLVRLEYLKQFPVCEAHLSGCTGESTEIHHKAGKIELLLVLKSNFLAVCRNCHNWIEMNPDKAKEMGYSKNRL